MNSGTIGAHVRHVVEHYQSLLLDADTIDYDNRSRNTAIETQPAMAINSLNSIIFELQKLIADKAVDVLCSTNTAPQTNPTTSSLRRELVFVHSHTTHHMAIIRILALSMMLPISMNFGKAASTQKFEHNVQS
ncbi:hypothetical protein BTO11_08510 [Psychrosphaera saromensis]|uniref:DinB-like domain-containing protein n=2 Tax=Psychrosphaera saromensis TaxID=716813 RepID=A0A2S7UUN9_9GAMM|nr:hypothetical protein BTO11_08510 [Psychrosphaera saromensis]